MTAAPAVPATLAPVASLSQLVMPMKAEVLLNPFVKMINRLSDAVSHRSTLPILGHYLIETNVETQRVTVSATNLEVALRAWVSGKVTASGSMTVPAELFADFLSSLSGDASPILNIANDTKTVSLLVSVGKAKMKIRGLAPAEFPRMLIDSDALGMEFPSADFRRLIKMTTFSAGDDISKPVLQGVRLMGEGAKFEAAAADAFRVSIARLPFKGEMPTYVIVPAKSLNLFEKFLDEAETVTFQIDTAIVLRAIFTVGPVTMTSNLIEGQYPDIAALAPKTSTRVAKFTVQAMLRAVKTVHVIARNSTNISARFTFAPDHVAISAGSEDGAGDSEIECGYESQKAEAEIDSPFVVALNTKYFLDALEKTSTEEQAELRMNERNQIVIYAPISGEDWQYLVMPMMVEGKG
jgi:DNA polymerase-3 subunit beta